MKLPISILDLRRVFPQGFLLTNGSVVRAVLAVEDDNWTWSGLAEAVGPDLLESVTRRDIVPDGEWVLVVDDPEDWRQEIGDTVRDRVEEAMAKNPGMHVVGVAHLIDSAHAVALDAPSAN